MNRIIGKILTSLTVLVVALYAIAVVGCGKRKPPLPPLPKVSQRAQISGFQRGNQVILSWQMPAKNASPGDVQHIKRVDIYRLAEKLNSPRTLSEEEFADRSVLIASVNVRDSDFGPKRYSYTDSLQFAGEPSRLRYAIRFVNAAGQKAAFSNFLVIEPAPRVASAPTALVAEVSQDSIALEWTPPTNNADGSSPVNIQGYNIYRSESRELPGRLLNRAPVQEAGYSDTTFEFDKEYFYFVRAVSSGAGDSPTESTESNIVELKPKDTFPPSPPVSITIAASPASISLFFPPNPENDVVGYKIFRSTDKSAPKADWQVMTQKYQDANTFQDTTVESGKVYFYYVTAVDKFENESKPSEVVGDTVP
ncbi:MAG: fibronectin type III domain-containing protein [Pyrinomonadaceae bacterium]